MRRKKHKHTRRSVSFYKVNYGFREPFKVSRLRVQQQLSSSSSSSSRSSTVMLTHTVCSAGATGWELPARNASSQVSSSIRQDIQGSRRLQKDMWKAAAPSMCAAAVGGRTTESRDVASCATTKNNHLLVTVVWWTIPVRCPCSDRMPMRRHRSGRCSSYLAVCCPLSEPHPAFCALPD
jgi:hypothetical protein